MWDNVPWFVGGGAVHSPEVARLLAFAAVGGGEGVIQGPDLKVTALPVPTSKIRVLTGAAAILNRAQGGDHQSYTGRLISSEDINVAATGSGSGRNDLVIARVEDPFMAGEPWADPTDPTVGPYIFTRILSNVPAGAVASADAAAAYVASQGYSAIPLAGLILPANTGTIVDDGTMIRDLRQVAQPRHARKLIRVDIGNTPHDVNSTGWTNWPNTSAAFEIPTWATRMLVRVLLSGIQAPTGTLVATLRAAVSPFNGTIDIVTASTIVIERSGDTEQRQTYEISDQFTLPAALRGTTRYIYPQAARLPLPEGGGGVLRAGYGTSVVYDIEFTEGPA